MTEEEKKTEVKRWRSAGLFPVKKTYFYENIKKKYMNKKIFSSYKIYFFLPNLNRYLS
jgi:hypothetical protein